MKLRSLKFRGMQLNNPLVVNVYGGPGSGKSTMAAQVFANLKWKGINCELVTEYAKDRVWADHLAILKDQIYLLAKQHNRMWRLRDKVDVIVTDSPLLLTIVYGEKEPEAFHQLVWDLYGRFDNMNFFLVRQNEYNQSGRYQTKDEALWLDLKIQNLLSVHVPYSIVDGTKSGAKTISSCVIERLKNMCPGPACYGEGNVCYLHTDYGKVE